MLSQPTQCVDTGVWRGWRRPPSEPPVSRAAAGASSGRGLLPPNPRTGALSQRSGAPLWSPASSTRTRPSSASRRPSGSPPPGSGPTRPSAASERAGSPLWSASRTTRRSKTWRTAASTRPTAGSSPSRRDTSRRRRGLGVTRTRGECVTHATRFRAAFPVEKGGSLPAPPVGPKAGTRAAPEGTEPQRRQRESGETRGPTRRGTWGPTRPMCVGPWKSDPARGSAGGGSLVRGGIAFGEPAVREAARRGRRSGSGCAPLPARGSRAEIVVEGQLVPLLVLGRPDRGGPRRRSKVPDVPFAAPPGVPGGPGPAVRSARRWQAFLPLPLRLGTTWRRGCVAGCGSNFRGLRPSARQNSRLRDRHRGAERRGAGLETGVPSRLPSGG